MANINDKSKHYGRRASDIGKGLERRASDSVGSKIARESGGFMVAEMASMATSLGVVAVADQVIPKPLMDKASKVVGKICIEPFLDVIEHSISKLCKLDECKVNPDLSREERAQQLAKTLMIFSAAYVLSMEVKLHTRRGMNEMLHVIEEAPKALPKSATFMQKLRHYGTLQHWTPQEKLIFAADEGVHIGSLFLLNNTLAPVTDKMIRGTTSILQKFGVDEDKAHDISTMAWVWEAANGLGALAAMGVIHGNHKYGLAEKGGLGRFLANRVPTPSASAVEQLAKQTSALGHSVHP